MASLREVGRARPESLVAFLPLVLDKLLLLMVKPPTVAGLTLNVGQVKRKECFQKSIVCSQAAFSAMAAVVRAVSAHLSHRNDSHGRNALLMTYIAYQVLTSLKSFNYWSFARLICLTWIRPSLITNMVQGADNASTGKKHLQLPSHMFSFPSYYIILHHSTSYYIIVHHTTSYYIIQRQYR